MKKPVKVILGVVGGLVLVVALALVGAFVTIDSIAEKAIESGGTRTLGVETSVEGADVEVFAGKFSMAGLRVANPEGYQSPHFMALPATNVDVSLDTLMSETISLPELRIGRADVYLDRSGGETNYRVILDNLEAQESGETPPAGPGEPAKKIIVDSLVLEGATVRLTGFGVASEAVGDVTIDVPRIELQDVGSEEPLTTGELIGLIVKTVLATTIEAGGGVIPADVLSDLRGRLANLAGLDEMGITAVSEVGDIAENFRERAQQEADEAAEKVKDAAGRLGDLLGGGGEKDKEDDG